MILSHVIDALYGQPWYITVTAWHAHHEILLKHFLNGKLQIPHSKQARPVEDWTGDPIQQFQTVGRVAVVPIKGSLIKGGGNMEKSCGACSYDDVCEDLDKAMASQCERIMLDMDTPGGMYLGCRECADKVAEVAQYREVHAYTDTQCCSGGYYIASAAHTFSCSSTAYVGSIGAICETRNVADALKTAGIEYNIFTSGKFKGMGHPARKMTTEQKDFMQQWADEMGEEFKSFVREHRMIDEESMEGQVFTGRNALAAKLVDRIIPNRDMLIKSLA